MVLLTLLLTTACLVIGATLLLYTPIPKGYSKPWQVHIAYSSMRLANILSFTAEWLGVAKYYQVMRKIINGSARLKNRLRRISGVKSRDAIFNGVPVRIYTPIGTKRDQLLPGMVYYHGGGFVIGSVELYHSLTARIAKKLNAVVVSVEYRLAPEHKFPAAMEDCVNATKYFLSNSETFGVDCNRVAIGGDSAGGMLTATVAMKLKEENFQPGVKLQILIYPVVQCLNTLTPSYQQNRDHGIVSAKDAARYMNMYCAGNGDHEAAILSNNHVTPEVKQRLAKTHLDVTKLPRQLIHEDYQPPDLSRGSADVWRELGDVLLDPYFAPLLAEDSLLRGLPKAYLFTGDVDVLRDDGFWFARRLKEAGVNVTHRHSDIAFHGIFNFHDIVRECSGYLEDIVKFMKKNL